MDKKDKDWGRAFNIMHKVEMLCTVLNMWDSISTSEITVDPLLL